MNGPGSTRVKFGCWPDASSLSGLSYHPLSTCVPSTPWEGGWGVSSCPIKTPKGGAATGRVVRLVYWLVAHPEHPRVPRHPPRTQRGGGVLARLAGRSPLFILTLFPGWWWRRRGGDRRRCAPPKWGIFTENPGCGGEGGSGGGARTWASELAGGGTPPRAHVFVPGVHVPERVGTGSEPSDGQWWHRHRRHCHHRHHRQSTHVSPRHHPPRSGTDLHSVGFLLLPDDVDAGSPQQARGATGTGRRTRR